MKVLKMKWFYYEIASFQSPKIINPMTANYFCRANKPKAKTRTNPTFKVINALLNSSTAVKHNENIFSELTMLFQF